MFIVFIIDNQTDTFPNITYNFQKMSFNFSKLFLPKRRLYSTKRKFPIDPTKSEKLPVFQYPVSKSGYSRVFVWGLAKTGALGVPFLKKNENRNQIEFHRAPKRLGFAEKHEVTQVATGVGFTVFVVNSKSHIKLYGTGINADSQIGYQEVRHEKPLGVVFFPQPIHLPFKWPEKSKIKRVSAGRAHLAVLTDEGLFMLGNNAYGQCGRVVVRDEQYAGSRFVNHLEKIEGKNVEDVECGQDHTLAITDDGSVYSCGWGADGQTGLGHFNSESTFTRVLGDISKEKITKVASRGDFTLALNDKGEVFGFGNTEYAQLTLSDNSQQVCNPTFLSMLQGLGKMRDIAAGGSFCMALNEQGDVFTWGYGLLGTGPAVQRSEKPLKLPSTLFGVNNFQPDNYVTSITCGLGHMTAITRQHDLYMWGRNRSCCLGLGNNKDQYFPLRIAIGGYVKQVACGLDHTVALCKPFV